MSEHLRSFLFFSPEIARSMQNTNGGLRKTWFTHSNPHYRFGTAVIMFVCVQHRLKIR